MEHKYGIVNLEGIWVPFNVIKQKPNQCVQSYYDILEKKITKQKIKEDQQKRAFLSRLWPKIRKTMCGLTLCRHGVFVGIGIGGGESFGEAR